MSKPADDTAKWAQDIVNAFPLTLTMAEKRIKVPNFGPLGMEEFLRTLRAMPK
jgi:hypothetical protein